MPSEKVMKEAMQAYIDGFNRADAQAVADLYADDATVEDPVGSKLKTGKAEITRFYQFSMKTGARLRLAAPSALTTSPRNSSIRPAASPPNAAPTPDPTPSASITPTPRNSESVI